jgi:hypothetical protein
LTVTESRCSIDDDEITVRVADAGYFHDAVGWSEIDVSGDTIMIGNNQAIIESIDDDTLVLKGSREGEIECEEGEPVIWCPDGLCPSDEQLDIGAVQAD